MINIISMNRQMIAIVEIFDFIPDRIYKGNNINNITNNNRMNNINKIDDPSITIH